jgi:Ca2+-binding EF-hand superfamily protein
MILKMLLSSQMPFYGRKREHIVEQIMAGRYEYKGRRWKKISKQGKNFIDDLLVVDPAERADAEQAMSASWLNRRFSATVRSPLVSEMENAKMSIKRFAKYSKLRKVALMVVAHKSTSAEIGILRKVFKEYDKRGCGQLTYEEFKAALNEAGYTDDEYRQVFDAVDLDGTGFIRYTEFLASTIEAQGAISEERLAEAFDRLDSDDSGFISAENLREILGNDFPMEEIDAIIKDASNHGSISYSDFLALWEEQEERKREEIVQEITVLNQNPTQVVAHPSDESVVSTLSSDASDAGESGGINFLARSTFIEGKNLSERKLFGVMDSECKKPDGKGSVRKVVFKETPETIAIDCENNDDVERDTDVAANTLASALTKSTVAVAKSSFDGELTQGHIGNT